MGEENGAFQKQPRLPALRAHGYLRGGDAPRPRASSWWCNCCVGLGLLIFFLPVFTC